MSINLDVCSNIHIAYISVFHLVHGRMFYRNIIDHFILKTFEIFNVESNFFGRKVIF